MIHIVILHFYWKSESINQPEPLHKGASPEAVNLIFLPFYFQGVKGEGRFYFEARVIESNGLTRVGWTTEDGSLLVGTDAFGFGYGSDADGFGISGQQGKRMHNNEIDNYGEVGSPFCYGFFIVLSRDGICWLTFSFRQQKPYYCSLIYPLSRYLVNHEALHESLNYHGFHYN